MRIQSVVSSCAVVVLSAVLSTGWAASAANNTANQQNNQVATPPTQTGGEPTEKPTTDTNTVMKSNEQDIIDSQNAAKSRLDESTDLKARAADGSIVNDPQDSIDKANQAKIEAIKKAQTDYCRSLVASVSFEKTIDPKKYCSTYFFSWNSAIYNKAVQATPGISKYCYTLGSQTQDGIQVIGAFAVTYKGVCKNIYK